MSTGVRAFTLLCAALLVFGRPAPTAAQSAGQVDPAFDAGGVGYAFGSSSMRAVTRQPDGKILVGGNFSSIGGVTRHGLARLNADGSVDATFVPPFVVTSVIPVAHVIVVQPDGRILVGGEGFNVGAQSYFLVRLMPDGSIDPSFTLLPMNASAGVDAITLLADGRFYIGGDYGSIGATATRTLTRMNADGSVDTTFAIGAFQVSGRALSIVVEPGGAVLAGGDYVVTLTPGGAVYSHLVRFSSTGTVDLAFHPVFDVNAVPIVKSVLRRSDGTIYAAGLFRTVNATPVHSLVRFTSAGAIVPAFAPGVHASTDDFRAIAFDLAGRLLVTGNLYFPGTGPADERRGIARLDADTGAFDAFYPPNGLEQGGIGNALAVQPDAKVLVAGTFVQLGGGLTRWHVARLLDVANTPPAAASDSYTTTANVPISVAAPGVLANDTDADGDAVSAVLVAPPASGTLVLQANGGFTFTPAAGFTGTVSCTYRATDGIATSAVTTVSIAVLPPSPLTYALAEGRPGRSSTWTS